MARWQTTANTIVPGWIETPMTTRAFHDEKVVNAVPRRVPERRWGTGDDCASIAVYFMSEAARYHTGDSVVIDGGYSTF